VNEETIFFLGVYKITAKMSWIHYLVGVSYFAECHENWENANKAPKIFYSAIVTEEEKWSRIHIWDRITTKS